MTKGKKPANGSWVNKTVNAKKPKINKVKVLILVVILVALGVCVTKVVKGVSNVVKTVELKYEEKQIETKKIEVEEQKKIDEENKKIELEKKAELDKLAIARKKYKVIIDPGHGGNDAGNLGYSTKQEGSTVKVYEKDVTLALSKKVSAILSKQPDIDVLLTRNSDDYVSIEDRVKLANDEVADVLLSLHINAEAGGDTATGLETYYKKGATDTSPTYAKTVHKAVNSYVSVRDRGVRENIFQVLTDTKAPSVLVECGFLTNAEEEKKLLDEAYQIQLAEGIAQGVLSFLDDTTRLEAKKLEEAKKK